MKTILKIIILCIAVSFLSVGATVFAAGCAGDQLKDTNKCCRSAHALLKDTQKITLIGKNQEASIGEVGPLVDCFMKMTIFDKCTLRDKEGKPRRDIEGKLMVDEDCYKTLD